MDVEYRMALEIEERLSPDSLVVAQTCNNIGTILAEQGESQAALEAFKKALEINKQLEPGSLAVAMPCVNIDWLLVSKGDADRVLVQFWRALSIREQQILPDSLLIAELNLEIGTMLSCVKMIWMQQWIASRKH